MECLKCPTIGIEIVQLLCITNVHETYLSYSVLKQNIALLKTAFLFRIFRGLITIFNHKTQNIMLTKHVASLI